MRPAVVVAALFLSACGAAKNDALWSNDSLCYATSEEEKFPAANSSRENEFANWLQMSAPVGIPVEEAYRRLEREGFDCPGTDEGRGTGVCQKDVWAGLLITRNWIAVLDIDQQRRVSVYRTNCAMTGF